MLEKHVKEVLKKYLREIGAYQYWPVPMGYGAKTIDVLICYNGMFFGIECKRPGVEEATGYQNMTMQEIHNAGGGTCVENSTNLLKTKLLLSRAYVPDIGGDVVDDSPMED